jgi:hypothetical protein
VVPNLYETALYYLNYLSKLFAPWDWPLLVPDIDIRDVLNSLSIVEPECLFPPAIEPYPGPLQLI